MFDKVLIRSFILDPTFLATEINYEVLRTNEFIKIANTAQQIKFMFKEFFSECEDIRSFQVE